MWDHFIGGFSKEMLLIHVEMPRGGYTINYK